MQLFYSPDLGIEPIEFSGEEAHHIANVLRLQPGWEISVTDGRGVLCKCIISEVSKQKVKAHIRQRFDSFGKRKYYLHIAIAPTKNIDRFEWFVEKATEIGIDEITPLLSEHSERKHIRTDRIEKLILAAMKQSEKAYKPVLNPFTTFRSVIDSGREALNFIAHCGQSPRYPLADSLNSENKFLILIGPEGDFSGDEIRYAEHAGYKPVSLGNSRLRTETAGIVACHTINLFRAG
jgi:16S rRNA (uracil1498-N3)-methyltransferase